MERVLMGVMAAQTDKEDREFSFGAEDFQFLVRLVGEHTGISLAPHKKDMVYARLVRRLRFLKLKTFADYCALLQSEKGDEEIGNLVNAITTNLTKFFREGHHFEHLDKEVLSPLASSGQKRVRIWSAGCSSGMEPYSIAMVLKHVLKKPEQYDALVLATDIDTNMLKTASDGEYPVEEYGHIPSAYRGYISENKEKKCIVMSEDLKQLVRFKRLNLLDAWPMQKGFDAIFCRNVMIYFNKDTQKRLYDRMAEQLKLGGSLYLGHSENIFKSSDRFELIGRTIYRRIK